MFSDMIPDLGKCPNQKTCKYVYLRISCVFWFGHFPRSGIKSENSFFIKCYIISVLIFFFWVFRPKKWRSKKWISHCIFKKLMILVGFSFFGGKNLKKPNTLEYAQVLVVTCRKLKSEKCPTTPTNPPPVAVVFNHWTLEHYFRNCCRYL